MGFQLPPGWARTLTCSFEQLNLGEESSCCSDTPFPGQCPPWTSAVSAGGCARGWSHEERDCYYYLVVLCSVKLVAQSCLMLWDPMDCSPPRFSIHGIFQARIQEWVAISFSRGSSWPRNRTQVSCIAFRFFTTWATRRPCAAYRTLIPQQGLNPRASLVAQMVKNPPAIQKTQVQFLGGEDPLEKGMATHSSILAWGILWTEEPGGLQSMGSQRIRHDWVTNTETEHRPWQWKCQVLTAGIPERLFFKKETKLFPFEGENDGFIS